MWFIGGLAEALNIRGVKMDVYELLRDIGYILKWSTDGNVIKAVPIKSMSLEERKEAFINKFSKHIA